MSAIKNRKRGRNPNAQTESPAVLRPDFPDVAVHGFGVDAPRAADAAQVDEQPLQARFEFCRVVIGLLKAQAFEDESGTRASTLLSRTKTFCNLVFGFVISEHDDFNARIQKRWEDVALQEVDDCHAVVGGDKNFFGH